MSLTYLKVEQNREFCINGDTWTIPSYSQHIQCNWRVSLCFKLPVTSSDLIPYLWTLPAGVCTAVGMEVGVFANNGIAYK